MSFAFKIGRAPLAINSLQPSDCSLLIGPGIAKTFRFSFKAKLAVTRLPQRKEPAKSTFDGLIFIHLSHFRLTCHFRSSYDNNKQAWPFITL